MDSQLEDSSLPGASREREGRATVLARASLSLVGALSIVLESLAGWGLESHSPLEPLEGEWLFPRMGTELLAYVVPTWYPKKQK